MKYKKWTLDQKLEILSVSEEIGIEACRKYSVSTGTFYGCAIGCVKNNLLLLQYILLVLRHLLYYQKK